MLPNASLPKMWNDFYLYVQYMQERLKDKNLCIHGLF